MDCMGLNRYSLSHPNTVTVTFPSMQAAGDYLFNFRNSPDFEKYSLYDRAHFKKYVVKNCDSGDVNAIEIYEITEALRVE